jgi:hypothetical protein
MSEREYDRDSTWRSDDRDFDRYESHSGCIEGGTVYGSGGMYGTYDTYYGFDYNNLTYDETSARSADNPGFVPYGPTSSGYVTRTFDEGEFRESSSDRFRLRGEILSLRMEDTGAPTDREELLLTLRTDSGEEIRVNLGPRERIARLDLRKGDRVTVRGDRADRDDRGHLMASSIEFRDDFISLTPRGGREGFAERPAQGEIVSLRSEDLRGQRHTVARVRLNNGGIETIDLGPSEELRRIDLREGDQIRFKARRDRSAGRERLIASQIEVNGETIDIRGGADDMRLRGQPVSPERRRMERDRDLDLQDDREMERQKQPGERDLQDDDLSPDSKSGGTDRDNPQMQGSDAGAHQGASVGPKNEGEDRSDR